MTVPVRLAKRLAESVPCSRREAELYIAGGWVTVDGQVVEEPQFMVLQQKVELHPDASLIPVEPVTMLFHQPPAADMNANGHGKCEAQDNGTRHVRSPLPIPLPQAGEGDKASLRESHNISAQQLLRPDTRAADDRSGIHLLKQHFIRLTQGMPLERNASGLLVFTQDFRVARKLTDDAATLEQEYVVEVAGELSSDGLKLLNHGLSFNGKPLPPIKVSWQNETRLRFAIKGVIPGQIAHVCKSAGLQVLAMKRLRIGRVSMAKLQPGQWRYLMPHERF